MPEKIYVSHLVKQRHAPANVGFSSHSGKLSALSQRQIGAPQKPKPGKRDTVIFGPSTYLEHSGNESSDEEYDEDDVMEMEDGEEYDEDETDEEDDRQMEEADGTEPSAAAVASGTAALGVGAGAAVGVLAARGALDQMEPDDGMEWDAAETEKVQRAQEAERAEKQQQDQRQYHQQQHQQQQQQLQYQQQQAENRARDQTQSQVQEQAQMQAQQLSQKQSQHQSTGFGAPSSDQSSRLSTSSNSGPQGRASPLQQVQGQQAPQQNGLERPPHLRNMSSDRSVSSASSMGTEGVSPSAGSNFMPSQVQAQRDRATSDASTASQPYGRGSPSPDSKSRDQRRQSARKSKGEEDLSGASEEKIGGKKRSSVFSGLFSRKDKKDRKSGSFGGSADGDRDSVIGRSSDDSFREKSRGRTSPAVGQSSGAGKSVQDRDRAQQQAYQQQFLSGRSNAGLVSMDPDLSQQNMLSTRGSGGRPARPGSLIGTPGSVPMLNVLRIFAGDNIDSDATFKTVLLNEGTTSVDLVRQAIQRFRLNSEHTPDQYVLTIKLLEGDERVLSPYETPLQVLDALTETHPDQDVPSMLSVKRSSVGSISSISSNLSTHPAIARLGNDFSDDHAVKFYLNLKPSNSIQRTPGSEDAASWLQADNSASGTGDTTSSFEGQQTSHLSMLSADSTDTLQNAQTVRFTMRVLIFPSDLPEGLVFDPQTSALIPSEVLAQRVSNGSAPADGVHQGYREKLLVFPRNTTVAEVIETGLDRFGIEDGVVEGGDDVEERTSRRRSRPRVKYGLSVDLNRTERGLAPTSKVLDAYPSPPNFKSSNRRSMDGRRRSTDASMLLGLVEDVRSEDPVFILRQVKDRAVRTKSARAMSPTQDVLVSKEEQRRQAELDTVSAAPLASAETSNTEGMIRQEIVAAQRAAAQAQRAAVVGAQRNEEEGIDVVLKDKARIRSSRLEGQMQYSYLPQEGGKEQDISSIIEEVLRDQETGMGSSSSNGGLGLPSSESSLKPDLRPSLRAARSDLTLDSFESAPSSPRGTSPLSLNEVHYDAKTPPPQLPSLGSSLGGLGSLEPSSTAPLSMASKSRQQQRPTESSNDLLETFVRNPNSNEKSIEDRIDQVLARVASGNASQSQSSSRGVISPSGSGSAGNGTGSGRGTPVASAVSRGINGSGPYGTNGTRSAGHQKQTSVSSELSNSMDAPSPFGNGSSTTHATSATLPLAAGGAILAGSAAAGAAGYSSYINRPGSSASVSLTDADQSLSHLYALTEYAARKNSIKSSMTSSKARISAQELLDQDREEKFRFSPECAGLFGPSLPVIEHPKIREAYRHVGKQMDEMDQVSSKSLLGGL